MAQRRIVVWTWLRRGLALAVLLACAGCADYRPGRSNDLPLLNQNLPSNGQPEPPNSRPR